MKNFNGFVLKLDVIWLNYARASWLEFSSEHNSTFILFLQHKAAIECG